MEFDRVAQAVAGIPHMSPEEGRIIYEHVRSERPTELLELGTAHGVSAAYMAAALDENGAGSITTLDSDRAAYDPPPEQVLEKAGLARRVNLVRRPDSSYTWFLKERVEERSDSAGNCQPLYDFCYLDGAHNWTIDGLAAVLVEKLLLPGGWLLLDDLPWAYSDDGGDLHLSASEQATPHMDAVYELLVKQHPNFTEFRRQDDRWGWARKAPGEPRRYELETTRPLSAMVVSALKRAAGRLRR
jgi:predicted O-methyltransferase YrrM